jgi:hypothetical protein
VTFGKANGDVNGDHRGFESVGEIQEGGKYMRGEAAGCSLFNERDPTSATTITPAILGIRG